MENASTPPKIVSAEQSHILLDERGRWFHEGKPVENPKISEFFHRSIRKDDTGRYYLQNKMGSLQEIVYFQIQDTAYFVHHLAMTDKGERLLVSLNTGVVSELTPETMKQDERGVMYCRVLDDDRARLTTNALHDLSDLVSEDDRGIFLEIKGQKYYLA